MDKISLFYRERCVPLLFDHDSLPGTLLRLIVVTKHTFVFLCRDTSKEMKTQKVGKTGMELNCLVQKIADSIFLLSNSAHTNGTRTTLNSNCSWFGKVGQRWNLFLKMSLHHVLPNSTWLPFYYLFMQFCCCTYSSTCSTDISINFEYLKIFMLWK